MLLEKLISLHSQLVKTSHQLYRLLLPPICVLCGHPTQHAQNICRPCQADLPILSQRCHKCARFLHSSTDIQLTCGSCQQSPPPFDQTYALFPYEPPIVQLIIKLKFQHQLCYAKTLGECLTQKITQEWYRETALPDVIIPIPLHPKRLRERGFNQALEIARPIASALAIPLDYRGTARTKHTIPQSKLPAALRKTNVSDAFTIQRDYTNLRIAVIDDVITTGNTMKAFCQALKSNGAQQIHVWCCARRG